MKKLLTLAIASAAALMFTSCQTTGSGALVGGAIGAGTGAIVGNNTSLGAGTGAAIGGGVGAIVGGAHGRQNERIRGWY
ncbi:MAG: glycine zipper domain-containing protein [Verrucomicrobiota bacterium]